MRPRMSEDARSLFVLRLVSVRLDSATEKELKGAIAQLRKDLRRHMKRSRTRKAPETRLRIAILEQVLVNRQPLSTQGVLTGRFSSTGGE